MKDSAGTAVYNAFDVKRFVSSIYKQNPGGFTYQGGEFSFSVQSTQEIYARGSNADFTIIIWNNGGEDKTIKIKYNLPHNSGTKCGNHWPSTCDPYVGETTLIAPAHGQANLPLSFPIITTDNQDTLWVSFFNAITNIQIGGAFKSFQVVDSSIQIEVATDKKEYGRGETVSGSITFTNQTPSSLTLQVELKALNPQNDLLWWDSFTISSLPYLGSEKRSLSFSIPNDAPAGTSVLWVEATKDGETIGRNSATFLISEIFRVKLNFKKPDGTYKAGEVMELSLSATNKTTESKTTELQLSIPDLGFSDTQSLSFSPSQTMNLNYSIPIKNTSKVEDPSGDIAIGSQDILWASVSSENGIFKFEMFLREDIPLNPANYTAYIWTVDIDGDNQEDYNVRLSYDPDPFHGGSYGWHGYIDPVHPNDESHELIDTFVINGKYLALEIPYGFPVKSSHAQNPFIQWVAYTSNDRAPDPGSGWAKLNRTSGKHDITVAFIPQNITKKFSYHVLPPTLVFASPSKDAFSSGETYFLLLKNQGGENALASYTVFLHDQSGKEIFSRSGLVLVSTGGTYSLDFILPEQLVTGRYHLFALATDEQYNVWTSLVRNFDVNGIEATSLLENVNDLYGLGVNLAPQIAIESTGSRDILGANLKGRIISSSPLFQGMKLESHFIYDANRSYRVQDVTPFLIVDPQGAIHNALDP
jgi:hypothetical protein